MNYVIYNTVAPKYYKFLKGKEDALFILITNDGYRDGKLSLSTNINSAMYYWVVMNL